MNFKSLSTVWSPNQWVGWPVDKTHLTPLYFSSIHTHAQSDSVIQVFNVQIMKMFLINVSVLPILILSLTIMILSSKHS